MHRTSNARAGDYYMYPDRMLPALPRPDLSLETNAIVFYANSQ